MRFLGFLAALALLSLATTGAAPQRHYADQVVELSVTYQTYDARRPWAKSRPRTRNAMAVPVSGSMLLTSAQMVGDATLVQAQKFGSPPKVPARVVHVDPEINLALLGVDEPGFFDGLQVAQLAGSLPTEGTVTSVRWRNGQLEVSASRVARIEVLSSRVSDLGHAFLRIKSDLGGGGWAEPVFADGRLVGLTATQDRDLANVVPAELIAAYLSAAQGEHHYKGFGSLGMSWQVNRNRALAAYLEMRGEPRGVVILEVPWGTSGFGVLEPRDILLALDGHPIDAEGFYPHPRYGRLRFTHIALDGHSAGDVLPARVLRSGEVLDLALELKGYPAPVRLIPWKQTDRPPPYLVAGGLVFRELDENYLASWGKEWWHSAPSRLLAYWELERHAQNPHRRRVVILMYVLPDPYNIGYHDLADLAVGEVNGHPVGSIADLEEGFRNPVGGFHRIVFQPNQVRTEVVLDAETFQSATTSVLRNYGIPERIRLNPDSLPMPRARSAPGH